ncbi:restriction endonuclease subunit S [Shewanella xiamenensis]|uniref:restriction endonuclease subunit S n=1 Tax=Shewanella xiamenensis TaxID=332186 RepID=UPI00243321A8|nr:restriction endonuclease subunit S [Shewanella xiamenensis]
MSWPLVELGSVANFINGFAFKPEQWEGNGKPIIRIQNLTDPDKPFNYSSMEVHEKYHVVNGDLLVSWSATLDVFEWNREDALLNQHIFKVEPNYKKVNKDYLRYALKDAISEMLKFTRGSTMKHVNRGDFLGTKIPLPPLETQKQIATVLEKADQLRKDCQQMEQELNSLAQSVFIDIFGDLRVKERYTKKVFFSEIFNISSKLVDPKLEQYEDMPHIGPEHIEKITGKILPYKTAKEDGLISGKFHFKQGCVLFSKIRPNLKKVAIPNFDGLCSADMYPLEPVDGVSTKEFIWGLILSLTFDEYLQVLASRANIPKINRKELSLFEFYLPSFSDQKQYSSQLIQIQQQIDINRELMKEVSNNFNALMQKAFSGELNLANAKT